ncbi:IS200/IS605 family transposase [Micromonospora sp. DT53]|uniref:IS200/IS605 family transposase n=1 Tax=Micromonospora sp. DT53 TaxID=3393444 RepID=UPI003CF4FD06
MSPPHPPLCSYQVVWCPKYRRPVLTGPVDDRLEQIIREVHAERDTSIKTIESMPGHVHLLVACGPQYGSGRLVKRINGRSSRLLREEFPHLESRLPTLRTNSYSVATTGGATLEVIRRYVENQCNA